MFGRRKNGPKVIVVEVSPTPQVARVIPPAMEFTPLPARDPRAVVIASILLNTPVEAGSDELPADLRAWARSVLGEVDDV